MKKTISALLITGIVAVAINCKEKKTDRNDAVTRVKMGAPISTDKGPKMGAFLGKGKGKAGAFRQEDVANADGRLLAYLLGCNLAELNIALQIGNEELFKDSLTALSEISKRANAVGNFPWAEAVAKTLNALGNSQIDKNQATDIIAKIGTESAKAAEHPEVRYNVLFGYATFLAATSLSVGGNGEGIAEIIDSYMASAGQNVSAVSKGHYEKAKALIAEGKSEEAGKTMLMAASTF